MFPSQWRHNEPDGISNHQPHDCLLNGLFRHRSKKISNLHITCLCEGNSPVACELPAQRASNAEDASIWWRHHVFYTLHRSLLTRRSGARGTLFQIGTLWSSCQFVVLSYRFYTRYSVPHEMGYTVSSIQAMLKPFSITIFCCVCMVSSHRICIEI